MSKLTNKVALSIVAQHLQNTASGETMTVKVDGTIIEFKPSEVVEKLTGMMAQLDKRNATKSGKPTKTQRENEGVKAAILGELSGTGKQCKTIADALGISGQKCSALLSQMVKAGEVVKTEGAKVEGIKGKVTLFTLPEAE